MVNKQEAETLSESINTMKKNYQQPEIWVEKLNAAFQVLAGSPITDKVVKTESNVGIEYGGEGNGQPARANGSLWDVGDEE